MTKKKRHIKEILEDDTTITIVYEKDEVRDTEEEIMDEDYVDEDEDYVDEEETYENSINVILGAPCSGKSSYVRDNARPGDIIWDFDKVHSALSGSKDHKHVQTIREYVFTIRETFYKTLKKRMNVRAWIINGSPKKEIRDMFISEFNANLIYLNIDKDEALRRASNERPTEWIEYIDNYFKNFEPIEEAEYIEIIDNKIPESRDMTNLNRKGYVYAVELINNNNVDLDGAWSFNAADGNKLLGEDENWEQYGKMFLAVDSEVEDSDTKKHYGYPFGKLVDGSPKLYRKALIAIRQRAGQMKFTKIFDAAGELLNMINEDNKNLWTRTMDNTTEKRYYNIKLEKRNKNGKPVVSGHAAIFDTLSEDLGGFREKINKEAFNEVLGNDVRCFFNHDPNHILARTPDTLKLEVDNTGLKYTFEVQDTQAGRDLLVNMENNIITQSSFAFTIADDEWESTPDGEVRTINKVARLYDVSPVSIPAYPAAADLSVAHRGLLNYKDKTKLKQELKDEVKRSLLNLKIELKKRKK